MVDALLPPPPSSALLADSRAAYAAAMDAVEEARALAAFGLRPRVETAAATASGSGRRGGRRGWAALVAAGAVAVVLVAACAWWAATSPSAPVGPGPGPAVLPAGAEWAVWASGAVRGMGASSKAKMN